MRRVHATMMTTADDGHRASAVIAVLRYRPLLTSSDTETRIAAAMPPLDAHARERAAAAEQCELGLLDPTDPDERRC
jgi:hypothetical protein